MANRLKVAGVVLIVLGLVVILGSPVFVYSTPEGSVSVDATGFYVMAAIGAALVVLGIYLYYLGAKMSKEKSAPQTTKT